MLRKSIQFSSIPSDGSTPSYFFHDVYVSDYISEHSAIDETTIWHTSGQGGRAWKRGGSQPGRRIQSGVDTHPISSNAESLESGMAFERRSFLDLMLVLFCFVSRGTAGCCAVQRRWQKASEGLGMSWTKRSIDTCNNTTDTG